MHIYSLYYSGCLGFLKKVLGQNRYSLLSRCLNRSGQYNVCFPVLFFRFFTEISGNYYELCFFRLFVYKVLKINNLYDNSWIYWINILRSPGIFYTIDILYRKMQGQRITINQKFIFWEIVILCHRVNSTFSVTQNIILLKG